MQSQYFESKISQDSTIDAFYNGKFYLCQPKKDAQRSGIDAMLLASCVPFSFKEKLADFGAGSGAAGLAVASKCPQASISLIEQDENMLFFAQKTCELKENSQLKHRIQIFQANLNEKGVHLLKQGLQANSFDFIIMNPPFHEKKDSRLPKKTKIEARIMTLDLLENWIRNAAFLLKAKGRIALILKPCSLKSALDALEARFGKIEIFPILPTPNENAIRILIRAQRDRKAPLEIKPNIFLRLNAKKNLNPRILSLCNGLTHL